MLSNTTARPRCFSRRGLAAEGLITAPSGARLPRSTAIPALRLEWFFERANHFAIPARRFGHILPYGLPFTVIASR